MTRRVRRRRLAPGLVLSLQILAAHPLRTSLSLAGLFVGVAAVIVMAAVSEGAERRVLQRLRAMGTNLLVVNAAPALRVAGRPRQVAIHTMLRSADAGAIVKESPLAVAAASAVNRSIVVHAEGRNTTTMLLGTTRQGLRIRNIAAEAGRLFDDQEARDQARVALLGPTVVRALFGANDPVGSLIRVGNVPFEVIGVMRPLGTDTGGADMDARVVIPLETAMRRVLNVPYIHSIFVEGRSSADLDELEQQVRETLRRRLDVRSGMPEPFVTQNQAVLLRTERGTARAMDRLVTGVAVLAFLLGGIGIVAVMLMSIRVRTREIGLRRALGATRRDIGLQFILESVMLASGGGAAGVMAGLLSAGLAAAFGSWELVIAWRIAALGFLGSMALGLLVGVIPAALAARLEPIAALRAS
jgi:putative ABC transport system permease protein